MRRVPRSLLHTIVVAVAASGCGGSDRSRAEPGADAAVVAKLRPDAGAVVASAPVDAAPAEPPAPIAPCPDPAGDDDEAAPPGDDDLRLIPTGFADLPGWADDHLAEAVPAFLLSCGKLAKLDSGDTVGIDGHSGKARDWRAACAAAGKVPAGDDAAARRFFEAEFSAYAAHGKDGPDGKMTSYNVSSLRGSRTRHGAYQTPLYGRPDDLISVDMTKFVKGSKAKRVWGRIDKDTGALVPYYTRAEVRKGALDGQDLEILWVDDPVDALFTNIEGSGRAVLDDGTEVWLEFDGKNGRSYKGVGKLLRDLGELKKGEGTMQGIRAWFEAHRDRTDEIIDQNASMVFFKISTKPGAVGSQGVKLTARRSLAVDRAFVAASTPVWVQTKIPVKGQGGSQPWAGLMIAQDTGGGIIGAVRGDLYWGDDEEAADISGRMGGAGRYWLLLPRSVKVR